WTQGASLPPLVTTSPAGTPRTLAGILGGPSTVTLFGGSRVADDLRSGMRLSGGLWLDDEQSIGIEVSAFYLDPEGAGFGAASSGSPILARPFFNAVTGAGDAELVAFPGVLAGSVTAQASTSLWGGEVNGRFNLLCDCNSRVDGLVGYRYLHL